MSSLCVSVAGVVGRATRRTCRGWECIDRRGYAMDGRGYAMHNRGYSTHNRGYSMHNKRHIMYSKRTMVHSKRQQWISTGIHVNTKATRPKTALFFPGQGVQRVGMCTPWLEAFPRTVKPMLDEIDDTLQLPLTRIIESGTNAELTRTENAQPAIMATSVLILRVLEREFGFQTSERVDVTLGHSLGEFAALVAGGYLGFGDALKMVRLRAEVIRQCTRDAVEAHGGEFGMVALVCESEQHMQALIAAIRDFLELSSPGSKTDSAVDVPPVPLVLIANINSKNQLVLSGSIARIHTLLANLRQFGGHDPRHVRLKSDAPFHSPLMAPARDAMRRILRTPRADGSDMVAWPGRMPCVSNVSGSPFESRAELKDLVARNITETVQWWKSVRYLHEEQNVRRYVGIGPGQVGRNLVGKEVGMKGTVKGGGVWGIAAPRDMEDVLRALDDTEAGDQD